MMELSAISDNKPIKRLLLLNQMAGPLFRELAQGLSKVMPGGCTLYTGDPNTLALAEASPCAKLGIVQAPIYNRQSTAKRAMSWLAYTATATWQIWQTSPDTAIIVVSNPPIMSPAVWLIGMLRRRPYVVLVYDIYPDIAVRMGYLREGHPLTRLWRWAHARVYNRATAVVTIARHMATHVAAQFSPDSTALGEVGVLFPWADTDKIRPMEREKNPLASRYSLHDKLTVLYSGNMGVSHDIDSMLKAANILKTRHDISFLFIGGGAKWQDAKDFQARHQLPNLQIHPYVSEDQLPYSMALGDISLVALDPGAEGMLIPSKLFHYMASGSAIIGIGAGENDLKEVIERAGCGFCVDHGKPEQLAQAIQTLADDPDCRRHYQTRAREAAIADYTPKAGIEAFLSIMRQSGLDF